MMVQTAMIPPRWLIGLGLAVLLAHLWLLENAPLQMGASESLGKRVFTTRVLQIQASQEPTALVVPVVSTAPPRPAMRLPKAEAAVPAALSPVPTSAAKPVELPVPEIVAQVRAPEPAASVAQAVPEPPTPVAQAAPANASAPVAAQPLPKDTMLVARNYAVPGSVRLKFNATGQRQRLEYQALGELLWTHDGKNYEARMGMTAWPLSRTLLSTGRMTADGLAPERFSDKFRSELAAHFDRDKARVTFSANTPDATLLPGAQDQLSVFMQLAAMLAGEPDKYPPGTAIHVQTVGPRSAEPWVFVVEADEALNLPGGQQQARKLVRTPRKDFDQKVEIWLAPALSWLPARIRITQANGDYIDQQWRSTSSP